MSETRMRTMFLSNADTLPIDPPAQARVEVLVWLEVEIVIPRKLVDQESAGLEKVLRGESLHGQVDIGMTIELPRRERSEKQELIVCEPRPKGRSGAPDLLDHSQPLELSLFRSALEKSRKGHLVLPFRV